MNRQIRHFPLVIIMLALFATAGIAQQFTGTIKGTVIDSKTREPLQGVEVVLIESGRNTMTDGDGRFVFTHVPAGSFSLEFSLTGYEKETRERVIASPGEILILDVELKQRLARINEYITVFGDTSFPRSQNVVQAVNLNSEEASKTVGAVEDISRVLKTIPGISQVSELSNELIVRGGSPWENGFYIDNIHVPNINHMQNYGGTGGLIGMINVSFIENVDFYTGGFSVAYGDRMSSITEIRYREGRRDGIKTRLNLNTAGYGGSIEGSVFNGKASWMLSFRRSYHDLIAELIGYGMAPRFGDINLKLTYDIDKKNKITLLNIYGDSQLSFDMETALEAGANNFVNYKTHQNTTGINWLSLWKANGYSETSLSYSFFNNTNSFSYTTTGSEWIAIDAFNQEMNLRNTNVFQLNSRSKMEFGIDIKYEQSQLDNYIAEYLDRLGEPIPEFTLHGNIETLKSGLFLALIYNPSKFLSASVGVRSDYYSYNKHIHLSPRLTTTLHISEKMALTGSFGIYHQMLPLYILYGNSENRENKDPFSAQFSLSLDTDLGEHTQFSISIYNKSYRNLPLISNDPNVLVMDSMISFNLYRSHEALNDSGIAFTRGLEILVKKNLARDLYGIVSLSLFRSRFKNYEGDWTNRVNDNQYLLTMIGRYKTANNWRLSIRFNLAGGVPYSPCDVERSRENNSWIIDETQINAKRYPPYISLNMRVDHQFKIKRSVLNVYLSVLNILNRKNILSYYWNSIDNKLGVMYQTPILPMFGIEYSF